MFAEFEKHGATVIGLSPDSPEKLAQFKSKYRLPFILASDSNKHIHAAYDARYFFGLLTRRLTYIIDSKGFIRKIIKGLVNPEKHVRESLEYFSPADRSKTGTS